MIFYRKTDDQCMAYADRNLYPTPDVPVMFNDDGIFEMPSKFLADLAINHKDVTSSVKTYADHLQAFFRYVETLETPKDFPRKKYLWSDISDKQFFSFIRRKESQGVSNKYVSQILSTVFRFYKWAEENKYLRKHVAIYDDDLTYSISAQKNEKTGTWSWPHLPTPEHEFLDVPTEDDIEMAHVRAFEESGIVGRRDTLLMSLYERTARRGDALQLMVDQIPSEDEIEEAYETDSVFKLKVVGKRKVTRKLTVLPELAEELRDYIDTERHEIVTRVKKRDKTYQDPGHIFLSYNDGTPSSPEYLSQRLSDLLGDYNPHRIRAKALTDLVSAYDGHDEHGKPLSKKDVLMRAAQEAGHTNWESLAPYLSDSRSRQLAARYIADSRRTAFNLKINQQKKTLEQFELLKPLVEVIESGKTIDNELLQMLLDGKYADISNDA